MSIKTMPVSQTLMVALSNRHGDNSVLDTQDDHLSSLKALAKKLHLETKRPSYMEWRFQLESQRTKALEPLVAVKEGHMRSWSSQKLTKSSLDFAVNKLRRHPSERLKGFGSITETVDWLRTELVSFACHFV